MPYAYVAKCMGSLAILLFLLSCCLMSTEVRWPIRDGDRVGRGRESERLDCGNHLPPLRSLDLLISPGTLSMISYSDDDDELMLNVLRCQLTY